jgi:hypothetical protein
MQPIKNVISRLAEAHDRLEHTIASGFERVGSTISYRPKLFFLLSLVFIAVCSGGIALIDVR